MTSAREPAVARPGAASSGSATSDCPWPLEFVCAGFRVMWTAPKSTPSRSNMITSDQAFAKAQNEELTDWATQATDPGRLHTPSLKQLRASFPPGPLGWHHYADLWLGQGLGVFLD